MKSLNKARAGKKSLHIVGCSPLPAYLRDCFLLSHSLKKVHLCIRPFINAPRWVRIRLTSDVHDFQAKACQRFWLDVKTVVLNQRILPRIVDDGSDSFLEPSFRFKELMKMKNSIHFHYLVPSKTRLYSISTRFASHC